MVVNLPTWATEQDIRLVLCQASQGTKASADFAIVATILTEYFTVAYVNVNEPY